MTLIRTYSLNVALKPLAVAVLVATTQLAGLAYAQGAGGAASAAVREDKAQLKEDHSALAQEKAQLKADRQTLEADSSAGKMAAESADAERLYKDHKYIRGERKDLARDTAGSLQQKADKTALAREDAQLKVDQKTLSADTWSGRMAAESPDAERVYKDRQAIKRQEKAISSDRAELTDDRKS